MNLVKEKRFYEFEEFARDYSRLAELFSSVQKIRLMGGEPLLNLRLTEYVSFLRNLFPEADLRIVTNGLIIPKMDDESLKTLKKLDCKIDISNYKPTIKMRKEIKAHLDRFGVEYDFGVPVFLFLRNICETPISDPERAFKKCVVTHCHQLSHGILSPCSHPHKIGRLNERYNLHFPQTDCIDIYSDITGEEIIERFSRPYDFCKYCAEGFNVFRWKAYVNRENSKKSDWLIKNNFFNKRIVPLAWLFLKSPVTSIRARIQKK